MGLRHRHRVESAVDRLRAVERPERLLPVAGRLNLAVVYPNAYALAMSNLGFLTVHRLAGSVPDVGVERFFQALEAGKPLPPPLYSFETGRPLGDFEILAFSFSVEEDFDRLPGLLGLLSIPLRATARSPRHHPLLLAGGAAVAANGSALSRIFDVLVPGEAETTLPAILQTILIHGRDYGRLAQLPGVWIPSLADRPTPVVVHHDVATAPAYAHILTPGNLFGGAALVEAMRGCPRQCAFCLARAIYHPPRPVPVDVLASWLDARPAVQDLGLVAPSLFDHPDLEDLLDMIARRGLRLRNSSVKWERLSDRVLERLHACQVHGVTVAPETGSVALRQQMGKPLREEAFFATMERVCSAGFTQIKCYFMTGFPGETQEDLEATAAFIGALGDLGNRRHVGVSATLAGFVPKKGTMWEHQEACGVAELKRRMHVIRDAARASRVKLLGDGPPSVMRQIHLARVGPEYLEELEKEAPSWDGGGRKGTSQDDDF